MAFEKKREGPTTTLAVHRCRFVDYAPSAITALAFPPLPLPSVKGKKKSSQTSQPTRFGTLAVGHANGNIDLCEWMGSEQETQCPQAWVVKQTLSGPYPSKVDSLAFVLRHPDDFDEDQVPKISDLRLFSSGGGSDLIEWDISTSRIRQTISSQGGAIWSIAANPSSTMLALGCEDGTVRIISLENDTLTHVRRLGKVKSRMLSIAWGPVAPKTSTRAKTSSKTGSDSDDSEDDDEDEWVDSWIVTGCSDSCLRKWDVKTGQLLERMGTDKVRGEKTLVWSVGVMGDGTIVSGDSMGMVKFWDSRTCTQLQSFQAHNADVLSLAISPEGTAVYTSGVDQKTVQFSLVKVQSSSSNKTVKWAQTASKRMHSHDVRALAIWPPYSPIVPSFLKQHQKSRSYFPNDLAPILVSGGLDMNLVLAPAALPSNSVVKVTNPLSTSVVATFEDAYHRRVAYTVEGRVQVAKSARLVSCVREAGLSIWRLAKKPDSPTTGDEMDEDGPRKSSELPEEEEPWNGGWEKVLDMDFNFTSNISAHRISDDGSWLAVSDTYETKLFRLAKDADGNLTPKRVKNLSSVLQPHIPPLPRVSRDSSKPQFRGTGSLALQFTPDSSKLVLSTTAPSYIIVLDLTGEQPQVLRRFDHHLQVDSIVQDRVIAGGKVKSAASQKSNGIVKANGVADGDVDMESASGGSDKDSDDEDVPSKSQPKLATVAVTHLAISPDGQWLASSSHCSPAATGHSGSPSSTYHTSTKTHVYNLDSVAYHTTLPSFPLPVQHLSFANGTDSPTSTGSINNRISLTASTLLLVFPNNSIQIYDVEQRQFPTWGKDLSTIIQRSRLSGTHDAVLGASFGSNQPQTPLEATTQQRDRFILFYGASWICKVSLDALSNFNLAQNSSSSSSLASSLNGTKSGKKRRRGGVKDTVGGGNTGIINPPATPNSKSATTTASEPSVPTAPPVAPSTLFRPIPRHLLEPITPATPAIGGGVAVEKDKDIVILGGGINNDEDGINGNVVKIVTTYRPILCAELVGPAELIVVERPLVDVLATLPPAYFRHRYGKS